jgi:autophagy-related protein 5
LEKIDNQFRRIAGADMQDIPWLEYNGEPVKWQYPVGVLYDMMVKSSEELPWKIHIRYKEFPKDKILYLDKKEAVKAHFLSRMKEADFLKHKGEGMNSLKESDIESLWSGLQKDDFQTFWSINKKLMLNIRGEQESFRNIPFVLYLEDGRKIQRQMPTVQIIKANDDPGCDVFSEQHYTLSNLVEKFYAGALKEGFLIKVHGIAVPMETPLQWLSEHMCYADNFVHIVIVKNSQP